VLPRVRKIKENNRISIEETTNLAIEKLSVVIYQCQPSKKVVRK